MDPASLRVEFEKQIKDADSKIQAAENTLKQLVEYKTKLQGGIETLELLNSQTENNEPSTIVEPPTE
jgi:hypothetical protein